MDKTNSGPFDDPQIQANHELTIRSHFEKLPNGLFNIRSDLFIPAGTKMDMNLMATMLIGALNNWCGSKNKPEKAESLSQKLRPLVNQMLQVIDMLDVDATANNLLSQLEVHKKIDEMLKPNAGNNNNTPSDDRIAERGIQNPTLPAEPKRPGSLDSPQQVDGGVQAGSLGSTTTKADRGLGTPEDTHNEAGG